MKTEITPEQFQRLRQAVEADDKSAFERLVVQIVQQQVRDRLARRESSKPVKAWLPTAY